MDSNIDDDTLKKWGQAADPSLATVSQELLRLRHAIRIHRDKTGHELCWLNDRELWAELGEALPTPSDTLPPRDAFLKQCAVFHESRLKKLPYEEPKTPT